MWRKKKKIKTPVPSQNDIDHDEITAFRNIGDTFDYHGVTLVVRNTRVRTVIPYFGIPTTVPALVCEYRDHLQRIHEVIFSVTDLPMLKKMNEEADEKLTDNSG